MHRLLMFVAVLMLTAATARADEPLSPADAIKKKGEKVSVAFVVKSSHEQRGLHFLNSEADFKTEGNFTIFIGATAMKKFEEAGIKKPSEHFKDKKIVVTGEVEVYRQQGFLNGQILLKSPDDIKIVEK